MVGDEEVAREMLKLMTEVKDVLKEHQQMLLSHRLLLMALSDFVEHAPQLNERYRALLLAHEIETGSKLPAVPISG